MGHWSIKYRPRQTVHCAATRDAVTQKGARDTEGQEKKQAAGHSELRGTFLGRGHKYSHPSDKLSGMFREDAPANVDFSPRMSLHGFYFLKHFNFVECKCIVIFL